MNIICSFQQIKDVTSEDVPCSSSADLKTLKFKLDLYFAARGTAALIGNAVRIANGYQTVLDNLPCEYTAVWCLRSDNSRQNCIN